MQLTLSLPHEVTEPRRRSLVCIPDLTGAQCALTEIKRELGRDFIKANIYRDRRGKTYSVVYHYIHRTTQEA